MSNNKDPNDLDRFDLDTYKDYYEKTKESEQSPEIEETGKRRSRKKLLLFSPLLFVIVGAGYFSWKPMSPTELIASSKGKDKSSIRSNKLAGGTTGEGNPDSDDSDAENNATLMLSADATDKVRDIAAIVEIVMSKMEEKPKVESENLASAESPPAAEEKKLTKLLLETEEALSLTESNDDTLLSKHTEKIKALSNSAVIAYNEVTAKPNLLENEHEIESGDTFYSIAKKNNTTALKIASYNHMKKDEKLKIGIVLKIPPIEYTPKAEVSDRTLASVAHKSAEKKKTIARKKELPKAKKAKKIASTAKKAKSKKKIIAKNESYKVKKGDNLYLIAKNHHTTVRELKKANKIKSDRSLRLGQLLAIPGKSKQIKAKQRLAHAKTKTKLKKRLASSRIVASKDLVFKSKSGEKRYISSRSGRSHLKLDPAKKQLGKKYVWGATGPYNFDCSGFTRYVCQKNGVCLPRTSINQSKVGKRISMKDLKAGDLIFFDTSKHKRGYVNHVGIYLGNHKFIHASSAKKKVVITSLNKPFYKARFKWGSRVKG